MAPPVPSGRASTSQATEAECTSAVSSPTWSSDSESGNTPSVDSRPYAGLSPTTPHNAAGGRTLAPVSEPSVRGGGPPATAAAHPHDEPPGVRDGSCGVRGRPVAGTAPGGAVARPC